MDFSYREQGELRFIGMVRRPESAAMATVEALPTFRSALRYSVNHSGLDQYGVATACGIDPGEFSRMLREPLKENARPREFPMRKLDLFCRVTNSKAPVQWLAFQIGDELIQYRPETTEQRLARLEAENARFRMRSAA